MKMPEDYFSNLSPS